MARSDTAWGIEPHPDRVPARTVAGSVVLTTLGVMPVLLVGAMAPFVTSDLAFTQVQLGLAVSLFFAVSALTSIPAGRLVERVGSYASGWIAGGASAIALVALGIAAKDWMTLLLLVALGGIGNSFGQLSANLAIAHAVPKDRHGLAFGIKQAAVPMGSMLGGLAVPVVALTVGWRWAVGIGPLMLLLWFLVSPRASVRPTGDTGTSNVGAIPYRTLAVLAAAVALGSGGGNAMATFFVASATSTTVSPAVAGLLLALGSGMGIATRVIAGWAADRILIHPLRVVTVLMSVGGFGLALLGSPVLALLLLGVVVGFGAGWGWNGLLNYAVVRDNPHAPARATGITQAGLYLGGVAGPMIFGLVSEHVSYQAAWLVAGSMLLTAAILVHLRPGPRASPMTGSSADLVPRAASNPARPAVLDS